MMRCILKSAAIAALASFAQVCATGAATAQTKSPVTFVSSTGTQNQACSSFFPCQNFFDALDRTTPTGTIYVQGPYFVDNVNLQSGMSIVGSGNVVFGRVSTNVPAGQNALLQGLSFENASTTLPSSGVLINGAGKVTIRNCRFNNFSNTAIRLSGPAGARGVIDATIIKGSSSGLIVSGADGASNVAFVRNTLIDGSFSNAIKVDGAANTVVLIDSTLSGSGQSDLSLVNGGKAISYRNNVIRSGAPTQSVPTN